LTKTYGKKDAAKDININIREGEIYGLIGRNGAGKTTIMRMISGLSNATSGTYSLFGKTGAEMKKMMNKVGVLIEHPGLYPKLSARENLKIKCIGMGIDYKKDNYIDNLLKIVGLENVSDKKGAGEYSLGMRQRLGIALALVGEPSMIILDEPINGLDPQGIVEVRHTLEQLRDEKGITIMISSHILEELAKLADSYGIIHEGKLIEQFTNDELMERCGQFVAIKTPDNDAAIKALSGIGITKTAIDEDGVLRVSERLEESDKMIVSLVKANVPVKEIFINNISLEDYYLSLTGGEHNG
ncbi:MAG: ATP-binding cassette domain-containing protein, partial [Ruminococcus sp.]|nr:ATP-binding cassette domain-containing protein [Ruminococcus sp.]